MEQGSLLVPELLQHVGGRPTSELTEAFLRQLALLSAPQSLVPGHILILPLNESTFVAT